MLVQTISTDGENTENEPFWKLYMYIGNLHVMLARCLGIQCGFHFAGSLWINPCRMEVFFQKELYVSDKWIMCSLHIQFKPKDTIQQPSKDEH